jgi:hypothetical protein
MRHLLCGLAACAVRISCGRSASYPQRTFTWTGDVPEGGTVTVRNIDGAIAVIPSSTGQVTVDAVILNAPPADVQVKARQDGNDVLVCTLIRAPENTDCGTAEHGRSTTISPSSFFKRHHSLTVRYTVHVPPGVKLNLETVNGRIAAQNVAASVTAETVNGNVEASTTTGVVNASTVNGSILVSMAAVPDSGDIHLETVNGSITAVLPDDIAGTLDLSNNNGAISVNYPHAASTDDPHHVRMTLRPGSRSVRMETVNGPVTVTRYVKPTTVTLVF